MPSSTFESDYLSATVSVSSSTPVVAKLIDLINEFPMGSDRRLELEATLFYHLSTFAMRLSEEVKASGKVTLYDI